MKNNLRPTNFAEFKGQKRLKSTLKIILESAKKRKQVIDHILLYGNAGLGKTSLATVLADESHSKIHYAQGPLLEKKSDIITLFGNLTKGDYVFIDEIHGINKTIIEILYSIIEDFVIDITVGPDGDQRIVRINLPSFTLIGATTKSGKLSKPLKDRFGLIAKMANYEETDIANIIFQTSQKLKCRISFQDSLTIAKYSKNNPRIGNNLFKRVRDFSVAKNLPITDKLIEQAFNNIGIYKYGLNDLHIQYLKLLNDVFYEKHVAIETISGSLQEEKDTIQNEIEVDLLKHNLIIKNSRGRMITSSGSHYITKILATYK